MNTQTNIWNNEPKFALIYILYCAISRKVCGKAHIEAILDGSIRLYRVNGSICLRKHKAININKLFINFLLRTCATEL